MTDSPSSPRSDSFPIGRGTQAQRLAQVIDDSVAGAKRAAVLLGVPGIGKTALLRWTHDEAVRRGCLCVLVRVPAAAGLPPRFPIGPVLDGLLSESESAGIAPPERLERVVATLTGAGSIETYAVALPQIADAVEAIGAHRPLGIFVDDYQWAPSEGASLLMGALRVVETPLCFVATARLRAPGEPTASSLPEPTADLWIEQLEVRGLEPAEVAELAAERLAGPVLPSLSDALYAKTLGNPLFVIETLEDWRREGALVPVAGYWGVVEDALRRDARSLQQMIAARLGRLDADSRAAADALAVIGRAADFDEIATVAELGAAPLVEALGRMTHDAIVAGESSAAPRYRFSHPLYASSLLTAMDGTRRALLHGRVCDELERRRRGGSHASAAELAHHAVRALRQRGDVQVLLSAAASEAEATGSYDEASIWYEHLRDYAVTRSERIFALEGRAKARTSSDPRAAIDLFTEALAMAGGKEERGRLLLGRARARRIIGALAESIADLDEALPLAGARGAFDVRHAKAVLCGARGDIESAESQLLDLARDSEGTPDFAKAWGHLGVAAFMRGNLHDALRYSREAFDRCDEAGYRAYLAPNIAWLLVVTGGWATAADFLPQVIEDASRSGDVQNESSLRATAAHLYAWRGDSARAFDCASRALQLASRLENPADRIVSLQALAVAWLENDAPAEAVAILGEILDQRDVVEARELSLAFSVLGEAQLGAGDLDAAEESCRLARRYLGDAVCWAVAADHVEARVQLARGSASSALALLLPWREQPSAVALEQAGVAETAAHALAARGDRAGAMAEAASALLGYESLGAGRRAQRVRSWIGERSARRPGRPRSALPGRLTEREHEILRLVVIGSTNRDIAERLTISLGTAKKHVENIMAKAGATRRTALVPFALGLGVEIQPDPAAGPANRAFDSSR